MKKEYLTRNWKVNFDIFRDSSMSERALIFIIVVSKFFFMKTTILPRLYIFDCIANICIFFLNSNQYESLINRGMLVARCRSKTIHNRNILNIWSLFLTYKKKCSRIKPALVNPHYITPLHR